MDHIASILLAFPPAGGFASLQDYDKAAKEHVKKVTKLCQEQHSAITQNASQLLDLLDYSTTTISSLLLFDAIATPAFEGKTPLPFDGLADRILVFLSTFDSRQIRYVGPHLTGLLHGVFVSSIFPNDVAVDVLATVILKIDPTGAMLTSHHLNLVKLAYRSGHIESVFRVIDKPIVYFPGMGSKRETKVLSDTDLPPPSYISAKDSGLTTSLKADQVLEYDLVCGLIYTSRRLWRQAHSAFERVITYPTREGGVSKIMTEAHNKWVLVSLLLNGRTPTLPPYTGAGARKSYETIGKPYLVIAGHFDSLDAAALKGDVEANWPTWQEDRNVGLIGEVLMAHQKWQIISLRDVYSKISVSDIRTRTQSAESGSSLATDAEVEALVLDMIESGMLKGHIVESTATTPTFLEFAPAAEELSEEAFATEIVTSAQRIKSLEPVLTATNERLGTSKEWVRHLVKEEKRERDGARNDGSGNFEAQVEDEDLMSGIMAGH